MRITRLLVLLFCLCSLQAIAQHSTKRTIVAKRIAENIKVDADLSESIWQTAPTASNFVQNSPNPGSLPSQKTEVKILYDDAAIYIGAMLYDTHSDSILQELTERDQIGNSDYFGVLIDAYQDGNNALGFITTPRGLQFDTKYSAVGNGGDGPSGVLWSGDRNWDAIWDAEARITPEGWVVEMKIPYSALRFPTKSEQLWNINFVRQIRRNREELYWNEVDPTQAGIINQSGEITGIRDIKSPVRLSATPFVAAYLQSYSDPNSTPKTSWGRSISGGMDVKYGINDAFTLDMTLIPDFGEARSDNQVLNLSPFEVRFDENRQFFTEGVELFNKGNFFYSRRVGGRPLYFFDVYGSLSETEEVVENPAQGQLLNATKVSGRTASGLGVGVFNATSGTSKAIIRDTESGKTREMLTNPITNYNVVSFDQNLPNNGYFTLINTNVLRSGDAYDANVTGAVYELRNKANSWSMRGKGGLSQKFFSEDEGYFVDLGHTWSAGISKISGKWQGGVGYNEESANYDPNDLGFLFNPNERSWDLNVNFNQYEPFGAFNGAGGGMYIGYSRLYDPNVYSDVGINLWAWTQTKNFTNYNLWTYVEPFTTFDYFEARTPGRYYKNPTGSNTGFWLSTDYRKQFAFDLNGRYNHTSEDGRFGYRLNFRPRFRFNDHFNMQTSFARMKNEREVGFVYKYDDENIVFGYRDFTNWENSIRANYTFNNKMTVSFRLRHYWASVEYESFHTLMQDGTLGVTDYNDFSDRSFNAFNIDLIYRWRFAPGSDIFVVWKNSILNADFEQDFIQYQYPESLNGLGDLPQTNLLSVKVIYYLDYLDATKWL